MATLDFFTTEELTDIVTGLDFFDGAPLDSFTESAIDELHRRDTEANQTMSLPFAELSALDISSELAREVAEVRSWIYSHTRGSRADQLKNLSTSDISSDLRDLLETLAEIMNIEFWNYSDALREKYSSTGLFTADDLASIVANVGNLAETEQSIAEQKKSIKIEISAIIEEISAPQTKKLTKTKSVDNPLHGAILILASENEKYRQTPERLARAMAKSQFKLDDDITPFLRKMTQKAPKQMKFAAMFTLNDMARDLRPLMMEEISDVMTVRAGSKGLVRKNIWASRAKLAPISQMFSEVGSLADTGKDRFTGFGEQEGTRMNKRKRVVNSKTMRGGRRGRRKVPSRLRMDRKFANLSKLTGSHSNLDSDKRTLAYLARLKRAGKLARKYGHNSTFVTSKKQFGGKLPKGMYRIVGKKKTRALQVDPGSPRKRQPRRYPWIKKPTHSYMSSKRPKDHLWRNMNRQLDLMKKFK